jgi:uncharacterized protein (DUF302 family)
MCHWISVIFKLSEEIMLRSLVVALVATAVTVAPAIAEEWITRESPASVDETADKLVAAVEGVGAKVFARVDHAAGAQSIGEEMAPMTLVMFGNPKLGTPILKAAPKSGLDLPIRVLIWDDNGTTMIGYLDPMSLKARYSVEGADKSFEAMTGALEKLTSVAAGGD